MKSPEEKIVEASIREKMEMYGRKEFFAHLTSDEMEHFSKAADYKLKSPLEKLLIALGLRK